MVARTIRLRPEFREAFPHELLKSAIRSACGFRVAPRRLLPGQLAVCDFQSKIVYYNSEMRSLVGEQVSLEGLLNSTLGHELGHIRLHSEEMRERSPENYHLWSRVAPLEGRSLQRELEADLYASVFLVPERLLMRESEAQRIYTWHREGESVSSSTLWTLVTSLAECFRVTPALMMKRLCGLGWISADRLACVRSELRIRGVEEGL